MWFCAMPLNQKLDSGIRSAAANSLQKVARGLTLTRIMPRRDPEVHLGFKLTIVAHPAEHEHPGYCYK